MLRELTSSQTWLSPLASSDFRSERFCGSLRTPGISPSTEGPQLAPTNERDATVRTRRRIATWSADIRAA